MINEAARCIEDQVVSMPEDVDFGMVMGTGFAPFRGGPLRYSDAVGTAKIVAAMERWAGKGASYFEPCASLKVMASQGKTFYHDGKATL
jgi:3-hydroxyacyl-CoA dehydrogenase/enoyl-CoA hydratase/3-hydroxybutyryl-CoA epimerase